MPTIKPYTTDTAAALRSAEIEAEVILLAKTIDGVYSADPKEDANAVKYNEITYLDILNKDLKVMDSTATSLCRDNKIYRFFYISFCNDTFEIWYIVYIYTASKVQRAVFHFWHRGR